MEFEIIRHKYIGTFEEINRILIDFGLLSKDSKINCYQFINMCNGGLKLYRYINGQTFWFKVCYDSSDSDSLAIFRIDC